MCAGFPCAGSGLAPVFCAGTAGRLSGSLMCVGGILTSVPMARLSRRRFPVGNCSSVSGRAMGSYCGWLGVMAIPWLRVVFAEENLGFFWGREIWHFMQTVSAAFVPGARA